MKQKVRITKQQIKEDKFTTAMLQTRDWLTDNWQTVAIAAAAVIIIIVGISLYTGSKQSQGAEAGNRLSAAIRELRRDNYQAAIIEFNAIADEYSGDVVATATFHLANAYFLAKNYDEAQASYQKYVDDYGRTELTISSAIAGIAACHESKQEFELASVKFMEAYEYAPGSANAPDYLLGAVRNYVNLSQGDKAQELVGILETDFPNSEQYRTAVMLSMKINP